MKIVRFALAACIVSVGFTATAQENAQKEKCKDKKAHAMDQLDLSDDQRAEIDALREELKEKRAALEVDGSLDEAARNEEMKALKDEKKAAMEEILTDDQKAKLAELKAEHKSARDEMTPAQIAEKQTAKMKEVIDDLTPEQEEQLHDLNLKVAMKIDAIKKDDSMSEEKKKEFIQGNKEDKRRMLETILTEAQLQQWDQHVASKKKMGLDKKKTNETPKSE